MLNSFDRVVKWVYSVAEYGLMVLAFFVAHGLRGLDFKETRKDGFLLISSLVSWMIASRWMSFRKIYLQHIRRLVACAQTVLLFGLFLGLLAFVFKEARYSRLIVGYFIVLFAVMVLFLHTLGDWYICSLHRNRKLLRTAMLVGHAESVVPLCERFQNHPEYGYDDPNVQPLDTLQDVDKLKQLIRQHAVNELFLFVPFGVTVDFQRIFDAIQNMGVRLSVVPDMALSLPLPMNPGVVAKQPAFILQQVPLDDAVNKLWKRLFDVLFSVSVLLLLSPVFALAALAVKLTSPGSTFFKQKRTGYNQKNFDLYKFRSMRFDREAADKVQATEEDPRITPFGRFMRKTNMDELPQFWNVLKGDMSVVGPRPHMLSHTEEFAGRVGGYLRRHHVRPGITGWAQVNGWRGPTDTAEALENRVKCDLWYVENWTLWLDIKIIWLTVFGSKTRKNAF